MKLEQDGFDMRNENNETPLDVAHGNVLNAMALDIRQRYDYIKYASAFDKQVLRRQIKEYEKLVHRYKHDSDGTIEALVV
jgi:hypothetical protein